MICLDRTCEPIFQYIAMLSRLSRQDKFSVSYEKADADIKNILMQINLSLTGEAEAYRQFQRIRLALLFYIDYMICEMSLSFADTWDINRLAYLEREVTGDYKFFNILDDLLNEYTIDADECLKVLYLCLAFGFYGKYRDQPEKIVMYMQQILVRIPQYAPMENNRLNFDVQDRIDTRNLMKSTFPSTETTFMLVGAGLVAMLCVYVICYYLTISPLLKSFNQIIELSNK